MSLNTPSTSSELPQIDFNHVNMMAREYAKGLNFPIMIDFVEQGNGVAWVLDDVGSGYKQSVKHIYINLPKLQQIVFSQTQKLGIPKLPTVDQIVQISLHEVGHLYENAQLMYRGDKINQSSDIESHFSHSMPVYVQKKFDVYIGNTIIEKRKQLIVGERGPSYHRFENMMRDVWVNNRSSDLQAGVWALRNAMRSNYTDRAFPGEDRTLPNEKGAVMPLYLQFAQGILRNAMTPDNPVKLDQRIQSLIEKWSDNSYIKRQGNSMSIISMATDVSLPFPVRLPYIFFLFEQYKKLYNTEKEENQSREENNPGEDKSNGGEGDNDESSDGDANQEDESDDGNQNKDSDNAGKSEDKDKKGQGTQNDDGDVGDGGNEPKNNDRNIGDEGNEPKNNDSDNTNTDDNDNNGQGTQNDDGKEDDNEVRNNPGEEGDGKGQNNNGKNLINDGNEGDGENQEEETQDNGDIDSRFREWEEASGGMPHHIEDALGDKKSKEIEDELVKAIADQEKENKKPQSRKYAEERCLETKFRDLAVNNPEEREKKVSILEDRYTKILPEIESTYSDVIDMIEHEVFEQIKSKRIWSTTINKGPRDMELGNGQLHIDGMANLVRDLYRGEDTTKTEAREIEAKQNKNEFLVTGFRLRIILDGSVSMKGQKNYDQAINTFLIMQACKNIACKLMGDIQIDPAKQLSIVTEVMIYSGTIGNKIIKPSSDDFTDEDIIEMVENIGLTSGSTPMHKSLKECIKSDKNLDRETIEKIKTGERVDTIIVMSDGQTDKPEKDSKLIEKLREGGTIVSGIGITKDGSPMKTLFGEEDQGKGCGVVCENSADLGVHLQEALVAALRRCI